jgi:hypothetical protein
LKETPLKFGRRCLAHTKKENSEIRGEALVGLALRNDRRTINLVQEKLHCNYMGSWVLEAVSLVGDCSLLPLLASLRDQWGAENEKSFGDELDLALEVCASKNKT